MNYGKSAIMSCMMQTRTNNGLFPSDFGQVVASLPEKMKSEADPTGDGFELLYHGAFKTLTTMSNPQDIIVIRQKQPTQYGNRWAKVYVCADGHCEVHTQADSDFAAWENQHADPAAIRRTMTNEGWAHDQASIRHPERGYSRRRHGLLGGRTLCPEPLASKERGIAATGRSVGACWPRKTSGCPARSWGRKAPTRSPRLNSVNCCDCAARLDNSTGPGGKSTSFAQRISSSW